MISGFCRDVHETCKLLESYATYGGNSLPTFLDNLSVPTSRVKQSKNIFLDYLSPEDGTNRMSQNFGKKLPLYASSGVKSAQISSQP
jgi:hypothetical protein